MLQRLVELLLNESEVNSSLNISDLTQAERFRALCNIRRPLPISDEFVSLQDKYLQTMTIERGVVDVDGFDYSNSISLWQGDITRLNSDAVVNACNPALLGCFRPLHNCIDNIIHSNAGVQVRLECNEIMKGKDLPNGDIVVTSAYNLPSNYIFHTVGPIVEHSSPTEQNVVDLKKCYRNSLNKAKELNIKNIAFCCLSTGVYGYPKEQATQVAVAEVKEWLRSNSGLKVIFNVFLGEDRMYYERELSI